MPRLAPPAWTAIFLAAVVLLWPAMLNHRPFVFYDTDGYQWLGESLLHVLAAGLRRLAGTEGPLVDDASLFGAGGLPYLSFMGARAPAYALFLAVTARLGSLWLTVYLQALAAAWLVWTLLRAAAPGAGLRAYALVVAGLAALTPLPFFVGFAMPDVFAGFAALAAALLLIFPDRLGAPPRIGLALLLALALAVHASHLAVLVVAMAAALLTAAGFGALRPALTRAAPVGAAIAAALAAAVLYPAAVRLLPGPAEIEKPPFLMARLLADGPGRDYLAVACRDPAAFELCRHRAAPLDDSEVILWDEAPGHGVVIPADADARRRLKAQEPAFVLGTLRHAPLPALAAAMGNFGRQLVLVRVEEPLTPPGAVLHGGGANALRAVLPGAADCAGRADACAPPFDPVLLSWLHGAALVAALALVGWRFSRPDVLAALGEGRLDTPAVRLLGLAALLVGFLAVNAAVCGVLSGPFARFAARAVWLAPLTAGLAALALAQAWPRLFAFARAAP